MLSGTVAGNLGSDAELKDVNGQKVCEFRVASNEKVKGSRVTTWVRCSLWGRRGEALAPYLKKGDAVAVSGTIRVGAFTNNAGAATPSVDIDVADVALLGSQAAAEGANQGAGQYQSPQQITNAFKAAQASQQGAYDEEIPF